MIKDKFNLKFREYVKSTLSPTADDRIFVSTIYESFKSILSQSCLQIGSYSRFTAIRPLHDLDIINVVGKWDDKNHIPLEALEKLLVKIKNEYKNPTKYSLTTSLQTHTITVSFIDKEKEVFSVDIAPGYVYSKNEFGDDVYKIPEVLFHRHGVNRAEYYKKLSFEQQEMGWIVTDPRGYIEVAKRVNLSNSDFRKTVKFIKAWSNACKAKDDDFKLKSFHIEQVVTSYYQENANCELFDGIFRFFANLPEVISSARIKDRANNDKYIDDYVNDLTSWQKEKIIKARDCFLINLEGLSESDPVENLVEPCFYKRKSDSEQYLFDFNIPTFLDDKYSFEVFGEAQEAKGSFRKEILNKTGLISVDRRIKFRIKGNLPKVDYFKWKVKNDNSSQQPRGEITNTQTRNDPEHTKYSGDHFVECYAILNNMCVAKARQNVKLERAF